MTIGESLGEVGVVSTTALCLRPRREDQADALKTRLPGFEAIGFAEGGLPMAKAKRGAILLFLPVPPLWVSAHRCRSIKSLGTAGRNEIQDPLAVCQRIVTMPAVH